VDIVKTATFKELPPQDKDWYYIRAGAPVNGIQHHATATAMEQQQRQRQTVGSSWNGHSCGGRPLGGRMRGQLGSCLQTETLDDDEAVACISSSWQAAVAARRPPRVVSPTLADQQQSACNGQLLPRWSPSLPLIF
jgi:hypothetical protein